MFPKPIKDSASKAFNHLNQYSLSKLLEGLTGPIGLMENQSWMLIRSLIEQGKN